MKYLLFILILLFSIEAANAQITFNKRTIFGYKAATLTNVYPTDSCYYSVGIIADSVFPYRTSTLFVKLDLEGDVLFTKPLISENHSYEVWDNTLIPTTDGGFLVSGYVQDTLMRALLIKFDNNGDIIFTRQYLHPNYPNKSFLRPMDMDATPDGGCIMVCWMESLNVGDDHLYVLKLDSLGNEEWYKIYGNNLRERPQSILVSPEGEIVVGAIRGNNNYVNENYTFQTWILGLDSSGEILWQYLSPIDSLRDAANDMLLLEDGSLIVASGIGTEIDLPSVNNVYFEKSLSILNDSNESILLIEYPGDTLSASTRTTTLFQLENSNDFILVGTSVDVDYFEETFSQMGWIHKTNTSGDSIWCREYVFLNNEYNTHTIYDIKETNDEGFILVGQSSDLTGQDTIPQQAWILKLDEYGCLVPGCHLPVSTSEVLATGVEIKLYPNPVSEILNFLIQTANQNIAGELKIYDVSGHLVEHVRGVTSDITFLLPVHSYPSGVYTLQYLEQGRVLASKSFIVQK